MSRILKIFLFTLSITSCKQSVKKDSIVNTETIVQVKVKQKVDQNKEQQSQKSEINFVKHFYNLYLIEINKGTFQSNLEKYFSEDLIKYVNSIDDGNLIINAQDYEKFDLNTLEVFKTPNNHVYKVKFMNMGNETIIFAKVKLINERYKITNLAENFDDVNEDIVLPEFTADEYYFESLIYRIEPSGDPRTAITFSIEEDFEGRGVVFKKQAYSDYFEYLCTKKITRGKLDIYHKGNIGLKEHEYKGDKSKPLITIYKKGSQFYAKSPLIQEGKEIKLTKED